MRRFRSQPPRGPGGFRWTGDNGSGGVVVKLVKLTPEMVKELLETDAFKNRPCNQFKIDQFLRDRKKRRRF